MPITSPKPRSACAVGLIAAQAAVAVCERSHCREMAEDTEECSRTDALHCRCKATGGRRDASAIDTIPLPRGAAP